MPLWFWALIGAIVALLILAVATPWLLRRLARPQQALVRRIGKLPWRAKAQLACALMRDPRLPISVRLVIPAAVLYLVLPLDIIPDFIPILGQLDDLLVLLVAMRLIMRSIPEALLDEHIARLERIEPRTSNVDP
jgi:uncharacterized membrane protein YkvA (DUF1232 family)